MKLTSARLLWGVAVGFVCLRLTAASPTLENGIAPADPVAAGRELAARLLSQRPVAGTTNEAVLCIRRKKMNDIEVPLRIEVRVGDSSWSTTYSTRDTTKDHAGAFTVSHQENSPNQYRVMVFSRSPESVDEFEMLNGRQAFVPFAGSDFWLADLGMEFLHWPIQRLLKKELCRSRSCDKLESVLPQGHDTGYARVVSWFDIDSGTPVLINAYNAAGQMVKEFRPTRIRKAHGNYELAEAEMRDLRTGSSTLLRFHSDAH